MQIAWRAHACLPVLGQKGQPRDPAHERLAEVHESAARHLSAALGLIDQSPPPAPKAVEGSRRVVYAPALDRRPRAGPRRRA